MLHLSFMLQIRNECVQHLHPNAYAFVRIVPIYRMLLRLLLPMLIHKNACMRLQNVKFNCMECDLQFEHLFYCNEIPHASQATHLNAFHSKLNFHSFDKIVTTFHRIAMRLGVCEYAWRTRDVCTSFASRSFTYILRAEQYLLW